MFFHRIGTSYRIDIQFDFILLRNKSHEGFKWGLALNTGCHYKWLTVKGCFF